MAFEYLLALLPALPGDPGGAVQMEPARLAAMCAEEGRRVELLTHSVLMQFDLRAMERIEYGVEPSERAIYSEAQLSDRAGLPEWLADALSSEPVGRSCAFDRVWDAYYRQLASLARSTGSCFLARWVSWEVGLRNAIARVRATRLGADVESATVEGVSEEHVSEYRPIVDSLISHMDAGFDAWREMDRSINEIRLRKARDLAPPFTFNMDELLSYTAQFVILRGSPYLVQ